MTLTAPPDRMFMVLGLELENVDGRPFVTDLSVSLGLDGNGRDGPGVFCRNGVAILTDADPRHGDLFLAGDAAWHPSAAGNGLHLARPVEVPSSDVVRYTVLVGFRKDASLEWIERARSELGDMSALADARHERLQAARPRPPELWMQEEVAWDTGQIFGFAVPDPVA